MNSYRNFVVEILRASPVKTTGVQTPDRIGCAQNDIVSLFSVTKGARLGRRPLQRLQKKSPSSGGLVDRFSGTSHRSPRRGIWGWRCPVGGASLLHRGFACRGGSSR